MKDNVGRDVSSPALSQRRRGVRMSVGIIPIAASAWLEWRKEGLIMKTKRRWWWVFALVAGMYGSYCSPSLHGEEGERTITAQEGANQYFRVTITDKDGEKYVYTVRWRPSRTARVTRMMVTGTDVFKVVDSDGQGRQMVILFRVVDADTAGTLSGKDGKYVFVPVR
jgi:hypothetical protein